MLRLLWKGQLNLVCFFWMASISIWPSVIDHTPITRTYSALVLKETQILPSSLGVKSVLINPRGTKVYALNLEGGSIYEFNRSTKEMIRQIVFDRTAAVGIDYIKNKPIPSFAEKPVESCLSHDQKILWVSLHNSGGIVPILLDSLQLNIADTTLPIIRATIINLRTNRKNTIELPLIKTGKTPKVIVKTADNHHLLVSNWSSKTISVLKINDTLAPYARKIATLQMPAIPRGIAIDIKSNKSYVAIMGANKIKVINNSSWKIENSFIVPRNPRHIVADSSGHLFVSFNAIAQIACVQAKTGRILFTISTQSQPRTIALSENQQFLFVTCYGGNTVDIFRINDKSFSKIYSIACTGKPVGITIYENENQLEAWVANYMAGNLKVFTFKKIY